MNGIYKARQLDKTFVPVNRNGNAPEVFIVKIVENKYERAYAIVDANPIMETTTGKRYAKLENEPGYHEIIYMTLGSAKLKFI